MVFLDASIVIYFVEQPVVWGQKASARLAAVRAAGEQFAATELIRMECVVGPIKSGDATVFAAFAAFFSAPDVVVLPITTPVALRAATIRATHAFQPMDSLHLATATEYGCSAFLTNDARLSRFPDISVEVLT
jgi:predicted nucleic acid-binding protein